MLLCSLMAARTGRALLCIRIRVMKPYICTAISDRILIVTSELHIPSRNGISPGSPGVSCLSQQFLTKCDVRLHLGTSLYLDSRRTPVLRLDLLWVSQYQLFRVIWLWLWIFTHSDAEQDITCIRLRWRIPFHLDLRRTLFSVDLLISFSVVTPYSPWLLTHLDAGRNTTSVHLRLCQYATPSNLRRVLI